MQTKIKAAPEVITEVITEANFALQDFTKATALPVLAVERSASRKLSLNMTVSTTWTSRKSCPPCPLYDVCYSTRMNAGQRTTKVSASPITDPVEIARIEADAIVTGLTGRFPLRVHSVGDCAEDEAVRLVGGAAETHMSKQGQAAWTYTHNHNTPRHVWGGMSVLRSLEALPLHGQTAEAAWDAALAKVEKADDEGWASALVVKRFEKNKAYPLVTTDGRSIGKKGLPCPKQTGLVRGCDECTACFDDTRLRRAGLVILFKKH